MPSPGLDESTGAAIVGVACVLVLGSLAAEFALRSLSRRGNTNGLLRLGMSGRRLHMGE